MAVDPARCQEAIKQAIKQANIWPARIPCGLVFLVRAGKLGCCRSATNELVPDKFRSLLTFKNADGSRSAGSAGIAINLGPTKRMRENVCSSWTKQYQEGGRHAEFRVIHPL